MSFLGGSLGSTSSPADVEARKQALIDSVRSQVALMNVQEIMNQANEKCYLKCVTKPGTSLSSSEETCISRCFDRYLEAFDIVSRTYRARMNKERVDRQT